MGKFAAHLLTRLLVLVLWLLHWLPLAVLAPLGEALGGLLYRLGKSRRRVVQANLAACFPQLPEGEREAMAKKHFRLLGRSLLERGLLWWAGEARIRRLVRIRNLEIPQQLLAQGTPVIFLVPHFLGLDAGGTRLALEVNAVSIYARQRNRVMDHWLRHGRSRFGDQLLIPRNESVRASVKAMKAGRPFYYLPDMDQGPKESIFSPFFGVPAATITGLPRLARMARAVVVPCSTRMLPGGQGYELEFLPAWPDFPGEDVAADVHRMNAAIEEMVRGMPEQYYWVHRRFKTRPPGEPPFYARR